MVKVSVLLAAATLAAGVNLTGLERNSTAPYANRLLVQWGNDQYFVVVLAVNTESGLRELPLAAKPLAFTCRRMPERQAEAEALCEEICRAIAA